MAERLRRPRRRQERVKSDVPSEEVRVERIEVECETRYTQPALATAASEDPALYAVALSHRRRTHIRS